MGHALLNFLKEVQISLLKHQTLRRKRSRPTDTTYREGGGRTKGSAAERRVNGGVSTVGRQGIQRHQEIKKEKRRKG